METESLRRAEASFRREHPRYADTAALDELRRSDFARLDAAATSTSTTPAAGSTPTRSWASTCELLRESVFGNPHSINPTSAASTELLEQARRACSSSSAPPPRSTSRSSPRTRPARCAWSARPTRSAPATASCSRFDNHNSVNGIREFARARGAETTYVPSVAPDLRVDEQPAAALPDRHGRRSPQPVRLPGAVELLRRPAPAGVDRAGPRARLGRAARRRRVRADQPARPQPLAPRLRGDLLLQDVRLADRRRLPARTPRRARQARATVVLRRDDRRRVRAARVLPIRSRRRALRGRHRQLPQPPGRRDRAAPPRPHRDRDHPRPRRRARLLAARRARSAAAHRWLAGRDDLRTAIVGAARRDDRVQLPAPGRQRRRRALRRPCRAPAQDLAAHRLLLQPGRRRDRVHDLARDARRRRVRRGHDPRRLRPRRSACPPAAPSAPRSGSPPTSPTSTASPTSPPSSSTSPTCRTICRRASPADRSRLRRPRTSATLPCSSLQRNASVDT